jgi:hypothetical protein
MSSRPEPLLFLSSNSSVVLRGGVDAVPDPLLLGKYDSAGNRTRTSGSVVRTSGHYTTEAVIITTIIIIITTTASVV